MVEKTIFIVKPIYIQTEVAPKKNKKKAMTKKQIYSEKMKAPDYTQGENSKSAKLKKKFKKQSRSIEDQSSQKAHNERQTDLSLPHYKQSTSKGSRENVVVTE